jgi:hypothetical protein
MKVAGEKLLDVGARYADKMPTSITTPQRPKTRMRSQRASLTDFSILAFLARMTLASFELSFSNQRLGRCDFA